MSPAWVFPGRRGSGRKQANIIFEWATCGQSLSSADDFGTHQELADLAAFLVSDQSGYVNGEQIVMDGGEQLKGASEFAHMGEMLTEEQWQMMKPKKKG